AVFADQGTPLRISLRLNHGPNGTWTAELDLQSARGESLGQRQLSTSAPHCSALDDSIALVVALLVDSSAARELTAPKAAAGDNAASAADSANQPQNAHSTAAAPSVIELPATTHAPREPWHADASLGATLGGGVLPGVAFGAEAGLGLKPAFVPELRLFAGLDAARDSTINGGAAGARLSFGYVGLEVCPWPSMAPTPLRAFVCVGQVVGRLGARAFGFDRNQSAALVRFALSARAGLSARLYGSLGLRFDARAEVPLEQNAFTYGSADDRDASIYRTGRVAGVLELGPAVTWR
ncbi:MAG TPA: hypothetical protein VGM44_18160, partial [Polyangiaceae bacterium]